MTTLITGNTYPVREQIKALGGRWDPTRKGWIVSDEKAAEARLLVESTVPKQKNVNKANAAKPCFSCGSFCYGDCGAQMPKPRKTSLKTASGLCTRCGDDCGGDAFRCGYED